MSGGLSLTGLSMSSGLPIIGNGETVTVSSPLLDLTQTWNDAAVTFTLLKFSVTDTASAAASLLVDVRAGAFSKFSIEKSGIVNVSSNIFISNGNLYVSSSNQGVALTTTGFITWEGDLYITRDAANIVAQRNGVNAQTFRAYNTYTDVSNYERGVFDWITTANWLSIGPESAGTGVARKVLFTLGGSLWAFGGTTSSFPALKRSTTQFQARLADDSAYAQIIAAGTATNDNAAATTVGEFTSAQLASASATSLTTATAANITSVSLTAGDWEVWGVVDYVTAGATTSDFKSGISTTTATFGAQDTFQNMPLIAAGLSDTLGHSVAPLRVSLAATTTVYLVGQATFSVGTVTGYGTIYARRMR